jgi:hypothetical protein
MTTLRRRIARILAALSLAACHDSGMPSKPPPATLDESEPNDSAAEAPWFGTLYPGSELAISGHVTSDGSDLYDGFAFTTGAPCTVRFTVHPTLPAADLDVCVYDPYLDEFIACFDSPSGTESGEVGFAVAGVDFHLVVTSAWAASSYLLEIESIPFVPSPEGSGAMTTGSADPAKRTLERASAYRGAPREIAGSASATARIPLAIGWIGELDTSTGELDRTAFAAYPEGLVLGD